MGCEGQLSAFFQCFTVLSTVIFGRVDTCAFKMTSTAGMGWYSKHIPLVICAEFWPTPGIFGIPTRVFHVYHVEVHGIQE